jgi:hypothetical protein
MKLVSLLSVAASLSGAAFVLGIAFDAPALALFTITVSAAVLLIVSYDYAPRLKPAKATVPAGPARRRRRYALPLAA